MGCITAKQENDSETKVANTAGKMDGVSSHLKASTYIKPAKGRLRDNYKIGKMLG
jgi:hypothetical protein